MNIYRNGEGYYDPTAGRAIANVMTDFYQKERKNNKGRKGHGKHKKTTSHVVKPRRRSDDVYT